MKSPRLSDADTRDAESREHTLASEEAAAESYASYIGHLNGVRVIGRFPEGALRDARQRPAGCVGAACLSREGCRCLGV